ncbi:MULTISPECIES: hypothetical protein [Burkholderia]|uniref:hypothetical protein n=1 Tax=Burkholderia TaxID=32008 RepID=UPI000F6695FB|nr:MULTISPECIES: hypothetical protein [Burkholderia]MBG0876057.1 hypothetical protein [Burkholderia sp. 9775_39]MBG0884831.1 hypothetical protein [Burkholderia sp. 9773_38]
MSAQAQVDALRERVNSFATTDGVAVASLIDANSALVLQWLPYLDRLKTGVADELISGVASSLVEAAACAALGLVRPALFSMRTEIDVMLTWLYFKDHRIEWENVNATGDGFKLKKEMFEYFTRYFDGFGERYGILKNTATRKEIDTYRFLSAHIHSQSAITLPVANNLAEVVRNRKTGDELAEIAKSVDEYISDVLMALFAKDWLHIPKNLMENLENRFKTPIQKTTFFKTVV